MMKQRTDDSLDKLKIIRTLTDYADAFGRFDVKGVAGFCCQPFMMIAPSGCTALHTAGEIETAYTAIIQELRDRGYSHSIWLELYVKVLDAATAFASGVPVRFANGDELERVGAMYLLRKSGAEWKIAVLTTHAPGTVIQLD
jgi:ketosteroid isomerase-like protein